MQKTDKTRDHHIKPNKPKSEKANTVFPLIGKIQERKEKKKDMKANGVLFGEGGV